MLALGLVLLAAFVMFGRGLGASGAAVRVAAAAVGSVAPGHAAGNAVYRAGGDDEGGGLANWLVIEVAGMMVGGAVSAALAGRWRRTVEKGVRVGTRSRTIDFRLSVVARGRPDRGESAAELLDDPLVATTARGVVVVPPRRVRP